MRENDEFNEDSFSEFVELKEESVSLKTFINFHASTKKAFFKYFFNKNGDV